jgi:hypothetical protein
VNERGRRKGINRGARKVMRKEEKKKSQRRRN